MAIQIGEIKITGTIDGLSFYKMYGNYFVREKSSLNGKRFWKDKAFEGSRRSCSLLARASSFASLYYRSYPKQGQRKGLFNEMTGRVKLWLSKGIKEEEALELLKEHYPINKPQCSRKRKTESKSKKRAKAMAVKKERLFSVLLYQSFPLYKRKKKEKKRYCLRE